MRHAIGRSRVTSDDLDIRFAKRGAQHRGGTVTIIDDVRPDALGLRVDVDADDAGLRYASAAPTINPACVAALPEQYTIAVGRKSSSRDCVKISSMAEA